MFGKPIPALQNGDAGGRTIYMNTFSQLLSADLRVAYLVLSPLLMQRYEQEDSGLHFVMRLHTGACGRAEEERIACLCREQGVLIDPLSRYCAEQSSGDDGPPAFVMRYGDLAQPSLDLASQALRCALDE